VSSISLTLPVAGTVITAGLHATNYTSLQSLLNGGLDTANWAAGKIFPPSKLTQEGATTGQAIVWNGSAWAPATQTSAPAYGTTLPGSPTDTQEAILVDSITLPTYQWRFRYNAGSANPDKWEFIGGNPIITEVVTSESLNSATYVALATAGPSFTVPRAGVYEVEIGFTTVGINGGTGLAMSYDIGGTGAVDADAAWGLTNTLNNQSSSRPRTKAGLAASTALVSKYREISAAAQNISNRWMRVVPVRVS
jgi:hypothetical protein